LILLFALVALIPASLLTANSAYSIFKLQEQISNLYNGILVILVDLDEGHVSLLQMKSDILSHIMTTNKEDMQAIEARIKQNEAKFTSVLANYKEISDFPLQVEIMKRRGLDHMISDDHAFITQVRVNWEEYQATRDNVLSLSGQNRSSEAAAITFGEANTRFDRLVSSYQKTVDLNKEIAKVLYEESNYISGLAYLYSAIVFAISFGIAIIVAVLLAKRLISPVVEKLQRAKKDMNKFASETSIIEGHHQSSSATANLRSQIKDSSYNEDQEGEEEQDKERSTHSPLTAPLEAKATGDKLINPPTIENQQEEKIFDEILSSNQLILLHAELYRRNLKEESPTLSSKFLQYLVSYAERGADKRGDQVSASRSNNNNKEKKMTVLITRAGSNLHRKFQSKKNTEIYLLSMSTLAPISKSDEGLVVISLTNTALITEVVRRALENNPSSIIIFDNVTGLINTIGFEKTHAFILSLVDMLQPYPRGRIVLLINKRAHKQHELQSIANIFNIFIQ
jgi:hypothetical protein